MMFPGYFYTKMFDDMFDDFDRDFFNDPFFRPAKGRMIGEKAGEDKPGKPDAPVPYDFGRGGRGMAAIRADLREKDDGYELSVELPGYKKEDISIKLDNGYLTISASKNENVEEKDEATGYIRRERYQGSRSRSFFVGKDVKGEDIKARMDNGILTVDFPKAQPKEETAHDILIEG